MRSAGAADVSLSACDIPEVPRVRGTDSEEEARRRGRTPSTDMVRTTARKRRITGVALTPSARKDRRRAT